MNIPEGYECVEAGHVAECNSEAWVLRHQKTGARIFVLENEDENKVFTVGFRTPPADSTGLPHILEHSVLCGSEKFPVKDPFIELQKSSLQTFLNAMTYPDKTIYPVASCNEKDLENLMDVYMDAVLHPAIYHEEKIFRQEGWHYEMETADSPLVLNGVVYNEMKGAFSSPEDVLERYTQAVLFPDTPYANESGGDPDVIPTLSYEDFLAFHAAYYHPSNSFIYLYGKMDMEEKLRWLDEKYLGSYDCREIDSRIPAQKPFAQPADVTVPYPIAAEESPEGKAFLSQSWVVGEITDPVLYVAFQVLESALLTAPGAPVKQALLDAGLGEDVFGGYQNGSRQPYFSMVAKNADISRKTEFLSVIRETLQVQAEGGINRRALEAALNTLEFKNREADFGPYPKGLIYGIESFDSWLYDQSPLLHLRYDETFTFLRENLDTGYFESLIRVYFLNNSHQAVLVLAPEPGRTEKKDRELAERLAAQKAALSEEEIAEIVRATGQLKDYQSESSTPEQLATLPVLNLSDIRPEAVRLNNHEKMLGEIPALHHEMFTSEILYLQILFRADRIAKEDIPYLGLLRSVLSLMPTEHYSYSDLFSEICLETGGISFGVDVFQNVEQPGEYAPYAGVSTRVLRDKLPRALELMREILLTTNFRDEKRLRELAAQMKTRALTGLQNNGHTTAVLRAASYASAASWFNDQIGGIEYCRFLARTAEKLTNEAGCREVAERLEHLAETLFVRDGMLVSLTAEKEDFALLASSFDDFAAAFPAGAGAAVDKSTRRCRASWPVTPEKKNEAFKTAAQIQYVARCGNFRKAGYPYTGALRVLRSILGDEYLWINVRVKGGAYGCMCNFSRLGSGYFVSYRDPNLGKTLRVYEEIPAWLREFEVLERDMDNYIIGTIGSLDRPMNPSEAGIFSLQAYMSGITQDMLQEEREQVLTCRPEHIRALAPYIEAILDSDQLCVVGNAGKIEEEKELFRHVESLTE